MNPLHSSLYAEHLEEVSFLQDYRRRGWNDPEVDLNDLARTEARMEHHIDALVVGHHEAIELYRNLAVDGDEGVRHGLVRVFGRIDRIDLFEELLEEIDPESEDEFLALRDALRWDLPASWISKVKEFLTNGEGSGWVALADAAGRRQLQSLGSVILRAMSRASAPHVPIFLEALGTLREPSAIMAVFRYLQQPDPVLGKAAGLAGLRISVEEVTRQLAHAIDDHAWAAIPLAVAGVETAYRKITHHLVRHQSVEAAIALGILGHIESITDLLEGLRTSESLAEASAIALYLITGAELSASSEVEEDQNPEPRFSTSDQDWQDWWRENKQNFRPGSNRYRLGRPLDAAASAQCLREPRIPFETRQAIAHEVRLEQDLDVRPDAPAAIQQAHLRRLEATNVGSAQRTHSKARNDHVRHRRR